jgi:uracil-DNA glycosylase family 4
VALGKRRAFSDWEYWGRPVPGFGDPKARLYILGLAPAAHGANRTGRVFTGDRSGDFLFAALARNGFANQAASVSRHDGLRLRDAYVAAAVRCAPPRNRPSREETERCRPFLREELRLLARLRFVLALGKFAHDAYLRHLRMEGISLVAARYPFHHGARHRLPAGPLLVDAYHPSQQNTFTGRLTPEDLDRVLAWIRKRIGSAPRPGR